MHVDKTRKRSVSRVGRLPRLLRTTGWAAALFSVAGLANALSLDAVYGGMAQGCSYDLEANYRIITAYVNEQQSGPKLVRPEGGKRMSPFLGKASLRIEGEFYTLTIAVSGASLYGIPVSRLSPYRGIGSGVAGVAITFPLPLNEVKAKLEGAGVTLTSHDHGWGEITPVLQAAQDRSRTELICDLSI